MYCYKSVPYVRLRVCARGAWTLVRDFSNTRTTFGSVKSRQAGGRGGLGGIRAERAWSELHKTQSIRRDLRKHTCFVLLNWASILWPRDAAVLIDVQWVSAPAHRLRNPQAIFLLLITWSFIFCLKRICCWSYASVALHEHVTNKLKLVWRAGSEAVGLVLFLLPSPFLLLPLCFTLLFIIFFTFALLLSVVLSDTDKL